MAILFITSYIWTNGRGKGMVSVDKTIDYFSQKDKLYILLPTNNPDKWGKIISYNNNADLIYLKAYRWTAEDFFDENVSALQIFLNNRPLWLVRIIIKIYELLFIIESLRTANKLIERGTKFKFVYGATPAGVICSYLVGRRLKINSIGRLYGTLMEAKVWNIRNIMRIVNWLAFALPTKILICTNDGTGGNVVNKAFKKSLGWKKSQVFWFPINGFPLESVKPDPEKDLLPITFLSTSRHDIWKRVDLVIKLFNELVKHEKALSGKTRLVILNDGPLTNSLKQVSKELKIDQLCTFKGALPSKQLWEEYKKAHFFLSFMDKSNVGNVLFEAMANKCVVVVRDTGDTNKIISQRQNGILIPNGTDEEMIKKATAEIERLLQTPDQMAKLGENAQKWVRQNLKSWEERIEEEYNLINSLDNR